MLKLHLKIKILLILLFAFGSLLFYAGFSNKTRANPLSVFDTPELKLARYWQGLNDEQWVNWFINYYVVMQKNHDMLYLATQNAGRGGYFKDGSVIDRPLIIWFVYSDGHISEPQVIESSGSSKYDVFYVGVIKTTNILEFPDQTPKIFMWDGTIDDVVKYLKSRGVLPPNYLPGMKISADQIRWELLN